MNKDNIGIFIDEQGAEYSSDGKMLIRVPKVVSSFIIPDTVTAIGDNAFEYCINLVSIEIPESVTYIGNYTFRGCENLEDIVIPSSLENMGSNPFLGCSYLSDVVNESPNFCLVDSMLYSSDKKRLISSFEAIEEERVVVFNATAEQDVLELPNTVETIGNGALSYYQQKKINIPDSVTSIGYGALCDCYIDEGILTELKNKFGDNIDSEIKSNASCDEFYATYSDDGKTLYCVNKDVSSFTIPESVTNVYHKAFVGCYNLKSVTVNSPTYYIEDGILYNKKRNTIEHAINNLIDENIVITKLVEGISEHAFDNCVRLKSIVLPNSVKRIDGYSFVNCRNLTSINIPVNVTTIGLCVFNACPKLDNVQIENPHFRLVNGVIYDDNNNDTCTFIESIYYKMADIPITYAKSGDTLEEGDTDYEIKSVKIADTVKSIGEYAFRQYDLLERINIPASVTSIGNCAFLECIRLESVDVTNNPRFYVENSILCDSMNKRAITILYGICSDIIIPKSIEIIGSGAFYGMDETYSAYIPNSVKIIEDSAFAFCALEEVVIPDSVISIGAGVFQGCLNLEEIDIPDSVISIGADAFEGCLNLEQIYIPTSVKTIGEGAFCECNSLEEDIRSELEERYGKQIFEPIF